MKVSVLQENLAHGLSVVSRAVSPRSTLPVLGNILVASDEGRLRLSATNLLDWCQNRRGWLHYSSSTYFYRLDQHAAPQPG